MLRIIKHMFRVILCASLLITLPVQAASWAETVQQAKGQTVYFNAWGGDAAANAYLQWVEAQVKQYYGITLKVVKLADAADAVKRIQTEAAAGRQQNGSVDLLWVNGENFATLKQSQLLYSGWAQKLPNWRYVDVTKPVLQDFSLPTEGAESPWGSAQLTFIADKQKLATPPHNAAELLALAQAHPGKISYPRPPDFTGTAFLEQLLLELTDKPQALQQAPDKATINEVTAPLWRYLDQLHPLLWRQGKDFPDGAPRMDRMLANSELILSLTFNPAHVSNLVARGQLPQSAYTFGFTQGMIGNVHFVAIPANSSAKAAALVVANFLLSPTAQLHKADPAVWGDPTVLDSNTLTTEQQQQLQQFAPVSAGAVGVLAEPQAGWIPVLEAQWLQLYGVR